MDPLNSFRKIDFDSADYNATNRIGSVPAKNRLQEEPRGNSLSIGKTETKPLLSRY